jgi:hypothetical protein
MPQIDDVQMFIILGKDREKDMSRFVAELYTDVPGSRAAVGQLLARYAENVREEWESMRVKPESPLPGERDWLFADADEDPLDAAIDAYLSGASINTASTLHNVSSKRLSRALADRGEVRPKGRQKEKK